LELHDAETDAPLLQFANLNKEKARDLSMQAVPCPLQRPFGMDFYTAGRLCMKKAESPRDLICSL
jgi:hypothetical protein